MREKKNNKGFTLVEVIIASCILVVALVPLLGSFVFSSRLNMKGRQREQAMTVAENIMEGIKSVGPTNALSWASGSATTFNVIPNNTGLTKSGTAYPDVTTGNFASYELADGSTLGSEYDAMPVKLDSYGLKIDNIQMGHASFDAYVVIEQSIGNNTNFLAYALGDKFEGAGIVKYFDVKVYVALDGGFDSFSLPAVVTTNTNQANLNAFAASLDTVSMAKYFGTVITQS